VRREMAPKRFIPDKEEEVGNKVGIIKTPNHPM
jgi:hypothetical protein